MLKLKIKSLIKNGDFDITNNTNLVSALNIRKQTRFSENTVFPFVTLAEFRSDLILRCRKIAVTQRQNHPWAVMTDEELLKSARLFQKDWQAGKEGFTLAAILLLGKDEVILSTVPHHRTDAILRRVNTVRYDDRDFIATNLIESYERLMAFTEKHLPDPFYLEGDQRISIRYHIFREIIVNSLIHREYSSHFPARFVIESNKVFFENSNKPHQSGIIKMSDFTPFPKNPIISSFFRQIHYAEELGSGFKKIAQYAQAYFGAEPRIHEKDVFRFEARFGTKLLNILDASVSGVRDEPLNEPLNLSKIQNSIFKEIDKNPHITKAQLAILCHKSRATITRNLAALKKRNLIHRVGSDKTGYWEILKARKAYK